MVPVPGVDMPIPGLGLGFGAGFGFGGVVVAPGQKFIKVDVDKDQVPASVKSFGPRLFVVEWHDEHELTGGTVAAGEQKAATLLAIPEVADTETEILSNINPATT